MSDLEDAMEDLGTDDFLVPHDLDDRYGSWLEVTEAARKYANPDMEAFHKALYEWFHSERPMSADVEKELIDAALGVTEDE